MEKRTLAISVIAGLLIVALFGALSRGVGISPFGVTINGRRVLGGIAYVDELRAAGTGGLQLNDDTGTEAILVEDGGNVIINEAGGDQDFRIEGVGSANALFIDGANGRVSLGTTDNTCTIAGLTMTHRLSIRGADSILDASAIFQNWSNNGLVRGRLIFERSRGTAAVPITVATGNVIGSIDFNAYDGTDDAPSASIRAEVDGIPGSDDMPGRLLFLVSPDDSQTIAEAMRISQDKTVLLAGTLDVGDGNITNVGDIALDTISADDGASFSMADNWTNAGNTVADLGAVTTVDINGGTLAGVTVDGSLTWSAAQNLSSEDFTNIDIDSGTIDGTTVGAASATIGKFTTVDVDTDVTFNSQARILGPRLKWTYVATDTVLTQADSGSWWGTFIGTAGVIFTLPTDVTNMAGVNFCFYNTEGYTVTIDPNQGASIIRRLTDHTGANERVQSTAEHDVLCLVAGNTDVQWYPYAVYGTWADID